MTWYDRMVPLAIYAGILGIAALVPGLLLLVITNAPFAILLAIWVVAAGTRSGTASLLSGTALLVMFGISLPLNLVFWPLVSGVPATGILGGPVLYMSSVFLALLACVAVVIGNRSSLIARA